MNCYENSKRHYCYDKRHDLQPLFSDKQILLHFPHCSEYCLVWYRKNPFLLSDVNTNYPDELLLPDLVKEFSPVRVLIALLLGRTEFTLLDPETTLPDEEPLRVAVR